MFVFLEKNSTNNLILKLKLFYSSLDFEQLSQFLLCPIQGNFQIVTIQIQIKGLKTKQNKTSPQWKCFHVEPLHISVWINWQVPGWALRLKAELTFFLFLFLLFLPCQWYNISADFLEAQTFLAVIRHSLSFHGCWLWVLKQQRGKAEKSRNIIYLNTVPEFQLHSETSAKWQSSVSFHGSSNCPPKRQSLGALWTLSIQGVWL